MARILQVCNTDFYLTKFLAPLVRALAARGHVVECVCEGSAIPEGVLPSGTVVHQALFPRSGSLPEFGLAIARLRAIIRGGAYDCVDSHNRNASIAARIAAWIDGVPLNLYTAHGFYFHDDQSRLAREATVCLEGVLARLTDHTFSQSADDAALMTRRHLIARDRIEVIGNGIDTERFAPGIDRAAAEAELGLRPGRFRVAATGRLVRGKGFGDLLEAFAKLRQGRSEPELLIIGGNIDQDISPFAQQFTERMREAGLTDHVVITGITGRVEKYLATADVFVVPSYREGLPRALLEAMAMELVAIATDIRGCREVISDGANGYLYPPHDVDRLAALLGTVYEQRSRLGLMRRRARARVVDAFDERVYVARQVEGIERLLAERRPSLRRRARASVGAALHRATSPKIDLGPPAWQGRPDHRPDHQPDHRSQAGLEASPAGPGGAP